jgi:type II secretory pathway component PulC
MHTSSKLWLCAAFFLVSGYGVSFFYWYSQVLQVEGAPQKVVAADASPDQDLNIAAIAMLFGAAPEKATENVKESQLSLKLVASYVVPEKNRSAAIISSDGDHQKLYYVGDKIQRDVELKAVQAGRILVKRNGVLESISLENFSGSGRGVPEIPTATPVNVAATTTVAKPGVNQDMLEKLKKLKSLAARDN